jgi:hypothetical protein
MQAEMSDDDTSAFAFAHDGDGQPSQHLRDSFTAAGARYALEQSSAMRLASAGASRGIVLDASGVHDTVDGGESDGASTHRGPVSVAGPPSHLASAAGNESKPHIHTFVSAASLSQVAGRRGGAGGGGSTAQRKVPEWVLRAVEEAKTVPSITQLEDEAWAGDDTHEQGAGGGSTLTTDALYAQPQRLNVPPPSACLQFAMAVFNSVAQGGIGAATVLSGLQAGRPGQHSGAASEAAAGRSGTDAGVDGAPAGSAAGVGDADEPGAGGSTARKSYPREAAQHSFNAEDAAEAATRQELEDPRISALSTRLDVKARGLPLTEPEAEPYLPLTDRRPTRPPRSVPSLASERQRLKRQAARRLREQEEATAEEVAQAEARSAAVTSVDTTGVSTQPMRLVGGKLVRTALGAAAAADEARRLRARAREQTERELAALTTRTEIAASASVEPQAGTAGPIAPGSDRHGAFLEVRGQFFTIPQAVIDRAAAAVVQQESDARQTAAQRALARMEEAAAKSAADARKPAAMRRQSSRLTTVSSSRSVRMSPVASGRAAGGRQSRSPPGPTPRTGRAGRGWQSRQSMRRATFEQKDEDADDSALTDSDRGSTPSNSVVDDRGAPGLGEHAAIALAPGRVRGALLRGDGGQDAAPTRPPLGGLASMTKASWGSWRRAPVRPVVARAMRRAASARGFGAQAQRDRGSLSARGGARPPLHEARGDPNTSSTAGGSFTGRSSAELCRLSSRLEGVDEASLGAGDLFELSRVEGDKLLQERVAALVRGRATTKQYLSSAVERQLTSRSLADLTEEELPLIRVEAEVARTLQSEAQAAGTQWFRALLSRIAALQEEEDVSPAQLLLLTLVHHAFDQGRQPSQTDLLDALTRFKHDEFVSPGVQLLLAFLRRFLRMPLAEFEAACRLAGHTAPAEVVIERAALGMATNVP